MSVPKTILITAASGRIGSYLMPLLLSQNPSPKLVLPTGNAEKLKSGLPSISGAEHNVIIPEGSVKDAVWIESLLQDNNVDTVFLCLTGTDEMFTTIIFLDAIRRIPTVKKVVYISILGDFTSETGFKDTVRTRAYPHLLAKSVVEHRLINGPFDFDWTVLGPATFFVNDYLQKANLLQKGELAGLSEHGISRVAVPDIALAARNVMYDTTGAWNRRKIQIGTKKLYDGADFTRIWSGALGKPLKSIYTTPEVAAQFEQQLRAMIPGDFGKSFGRSFRLLYEYLQDHGMSMTEAEYEDQVRLLGKEPDAYEPWAEEIAKAWLRG